MSQMENLLSLLHNNFRPGRTVYGLEDLMTAYLGWLMREDAGIREKIVRLATGVDLDFSNVEVKNQVAIAGGRLDLVVEGGHEDRRWCLVFEAKVDSVLGPKQLERYNEWLQLREKRGVFPGRAFLCTLTRAQDCREMEEHARGLDTFTEAVSWSQVHDCLSTYVKRHPGANIPGDQNVAVTFARWFMELLEEQNMVPPRPLKPERLAELYAEKGTYEEFARNAAALISRSLELPNTTDRPDTDIVHLMRERGFERHRFRFGPAFGQLEEQGGRLRATFSMDDWPYTFFLFGYQMEELEKDKHVRPPEKLISANNLRGGGAKLIALFEIDANYPATDRFEEKKHLSEAEEWCHAMNARLTERSQTGSGCTPIFIPEDTSYCKFVRLCDMSGWPEDEQIAGMKTFFREFVEAFDANVGAAGENVLKKLKDLHSPQES